MTGTSRRTPTARGQLARFAVVLALLSGLGFMVGLQCTGGMATEMSVARGGTAMACDPPPTTSSAAEHTVSAMCAMPAAAFAEDGSSGWDGLGGILVTCLAFLVAVVAAAATVRPGRLGGVVRIPRPALVPALRAIRPQAPSLAELCLLRT